MLSVGCRKKNPDGPEPADMRVMSGLGIDFIFVRPRRAEIQKLSKQGWKLVSVCPTSSSEFGVDELTAFLKKKNE